MPRVKQWRNPEIRNVKNCCCRDKMTSNSPGPVWRCFIIILKEDFAQNEFSGKKYLIFLIIFFLSWSFGILLWELSTMGKEKQSKNLPFCSGFLTVFYFRYLLSDPMQINLLYLSSESSIEIQCFTNSNNQIKQEIMHLSSAASLNNYCRSIHLVAHNAYRHQYVDCFSFLTDLQ